MDLFVYFGEPSSLVVGLRFCKEIYRKFMLQVVSEFLLVRALLFFRIRSLPYLLSTVFIGLLYTTEV